MRFFVSFFLVLFLALPAFSADYTAGKGCPPKVNHQAVDNVEYQPGKSASGYGVAPADEFPAAITNDDLRNINVPLNMPVADYIDNGRILSDASNNTEVNFNKDRMELNVGNISVDAKAGNVKFNNRNINSVEPNEIDPDCWK